MLYDTRAGKYPNLRKEDDSYFNRARITSILPHDNTVWIGTGEGNLIIYEVLEKMMCPTPSEASFAENYPENMHLGSQKEESQGYDPVRAVEEKVRELYFKSLNNPDSISARAEPALPPPSKEANEVLEMREFCRNNLMSSTPTDNRSHDGSVDQERSESCPTTWFDTFSKTISKLDGESEDYSLFTDREDKQETQDNKSEVQTRRNCLTRSGLAKTSETDSVLSNGDADFVESQSSMCNGDVHRDQSDEMDPRVATIEEESLEVSIHEDIESFDQTISSTDSLDSQEGTRRFVDMKSVSIDSGIRIGSEDVPHPSDADPNHKQGSRQNSEQIHSQKQDTVNPSLESANPDTTKMNGHISDSDVSSETGGDSSNLLTVQMRDSSNHSSARTLCTDTEIDYISAKEPEISDSVNCNESFKRLRRLSGKKPLTKQKSINSSVNQKEDSDDEVFMDADEKQMKKASSLENVLSSVDEAFEVKSGHSPDASPRGQLKSVASEQNIQPKNQEAQWRIDFTGLHVDTDTESRISGMSIDGYSDFDSISQVHRQSIDSQPELKQFSKQNNILTNFDPKNFIFPDDFSLEQKMAKFLHTPSMGTPQSSNTWSCYGSTQTHDLDTSSADQRRSLLLRAESLQSDVSRGASSISLATMAESLYASDLFVQAKVKISDKPVKCLTHLKYGEEQMILSLSGSFGDDEAVLKWTRVPNEMIWTNDPILEFCMDTNQPKLPSYMRNRMSSTSSVTSNKSNWSNGSVKQFSIGSD